MRNDLIRRYVARSLPIVATLALASPATYAWDFQSADGTFSGSWDTTFPTARRGASIDRDCNLIATADGGCGRSPNIDDGDLNYDTGVFSTAFKAVSELSLNNPVGAFVRGSALYDDRQGNNTGARRSRRNPNDLVQELLTAARRLRLLRFNTWQACPRNCALGRQVVSWGESTFIQGGLNAINHFDVSALRVPGSELKEAFLPQEMAVFNLQFTDNLSTQLSTSWTGTRPSRSRSGSYFSTNDFAVTGRRARWCSASARSPTRASTSARWARRVPASSPNFQKVLRGATRASRRTAASAASTSSSSCRTSTTAPSSACTSSTITAACR